MSPTTSTPVLRISAVITVTCLDSDPAGCTTLAASLSFISCSGLRCDCGELIIILDLGFGVRPFAIRYYSRLNACHRSRAWQICQAGRRCFDTDVFQHVRLTLHLPNCACDRHACLYHFQSIPPRQPPWAATAQ